MNKFFSFNLDFLGFITSFVCALHCITIPVIFSLGLIGSSSITHNHYFDIILVGLGLILASSSIIKDYYKSRNIQPLTVGLIGMVLLIVGLSGHDFIQNICSVIGGCLLASAHVLNWRINRKSIA